MADPFGWLGATRRLQVAEKLDRLLEAWWQAWGIGDAPINVIEGDLQASSDGQWWYAKAKGGVAVRADSSPSLANVLTGIAGEQANSLANHLGESALKDLLERLVHPPGASARVDAEARHELPDTLRRTPFGAGHFSYQVRGVRLSLCMDRDAIARFAPSKPASMKPLVGRLEGLHPASIRLHAMLDLGAITLGELRDLHAGDVIATDTLLTQLFDLRIDENGKRISHARLGSQNGRRALLIQAAE